MDVSVSICDFLYSIPTWEREFYVILDGQKNHSFETKRANAEWKLDKRYLRHLMTLFAASWRNPLNL